MDYIVTYKICGKEHKTKVKADNYYSAQIKIRDSLVFISVEPVEDETVTKLKKMFGMG